MSLPARTLIALVAGMTLGVLAAASPDGFLAGMAGIMEPVGMLWISALRMTVIPLVVSLLLVGIASTEARSVGRLGLWTVGFFAVAVPVVALLTALVAIPLVDALPLGTAAAPAASAPVASSPGLAEWVTGLVPVNPVRAASEGAMIPLIVFTVVLALALTRLPQATAAPALAFFKAIGDAMLVIVRWVLQAGPVGVFALAMSTGAKLGLSAAGAVAGYIVLVSVLLVLGTVLMYPVAVLGGGVSLRRFTNACFAPQALAVSSRSSLASLPAMLDSSERHLGLPARVSGFTLPLAVSVFKMSTPIALTTGAICFGRMYGVDVGMAQIGTLVVGALLMNVATPGIPNGGPLVYAPVFMALGIPVEAIGLLLAVDAIPDIFKTVINVTADMAAATVVAQHVAVPVAVPAGLAAGAAPA